MINRDDYKRKGKHHRVAINIRMRCIMPGRRPIREDIEEVLEEILEHNTVPIGWQVAFIEWGYPKGASVDWKPRNGRGGDIGDIQQFYPVIQDQLKEMRIAVIRNDEQTGEEI